MATNTTLALLTSNPHKVEEWLAICQEYAPWLTVIAWSPLVDVEENGATFEANARLKAEAGLTETLHADVRWIVGEDAGLIVPALSGAYGLVDFPGVYSNRWFTPDIAVSLGIDTARFKTLAQARNEALLRLMQGKAQRDACYVSSLVCLDRSSTGGPDVTLFEGRLPVTVGTHHLGEGGFGYDPIMLHTDGRSMAQLSAGEKNAISHRRLAIEGLLKQLVF